MRTNHNGGALAFGPDEKLYIAVGENAVASNAQSLGNRLGKILRLNKDGSIPSDNPFFSTASGVNRAIWALGLRNPFTFAFNASGTSMFINDVGQGTWEEINEGRAGANYGWPTTEGATTDPRFDPPTTRLPAQRLFPYALRHCRRRVLHAGYRTVSVRATSTIIFLRTIARGGSGDWIRSLTRSPDSPPASALQST